MSDDRDDLDEMDPALRQQYQELRRQYLSEASERLAELRADLAASRACEADSLASLKTRFHKLAGSGGSYGFPAITEASREAEAWLGEHPAPDDAGYAYLEAAIRKVAAAFEDAKRITEGDREQGAGGRGER